MQSAERIAQQVKIKNGIFDFYSLIFNYCLLVTDTFNSEFLIQSETIQIWQSYCKDWWYPTKLLS